MQFFAPGKKQRTNDERSRVTLPFPFSISLASQTGQICWDKGTTVASISCDFAGWKSLSAEGAPVVAKFWQDALTSFAPDWCHKVGTKM
jgi:hypothetical protein